jgi:hypothetical protein
MFKRHYAWHVRIQQEGGHFRVYYQHDFPRGVIEEERDPRRFNSLEEAEQFAKDVRRANRIFTALDRRRH